MNLFFNLKTKPLYKSYTYILIKMSNSSNQDQTSSTDRHTGCVKWFDNALNYGFITVISEGEYQGKDIFVHQSGVQTRNRETYRSLNCGECVQFNITNTNNDKHPEHATEVTGFGENRLQCENPFLRSRPRRGPPQQGGGGGGRRPYRSGGGRHQGADDEVTESRD